MPALLATFAALPTWARRAIYYIAIALLACLLIWIWLRGHDRRVIERHEAGITAEVTKRDAAGDVAGTKVSSEQKAAVEAQNARASEAARNSDDPLRDGLNTLGGR